MASNVSLRKSLRKIPAFYALGRDELKAVVERLICKEYQPNEVLWRTSAQTDFLGIIQEGEIAIEYRHNGAIIRTTRLSAGDLILPRKLQGQEQNTLVLARAITNVRLYVLRIDQIEKLRPILPQPETRSTLAQRYGRFKPSTGFWLVSILAAILLLAWSDISRIVSGSIYLRSTTQFTLDDFQAITLLERAKAFDHQASFAYNQEGYLWFQNDNLEDAERAFIESIGIEPQNGPALNNLAVTYFTSGNRQQAVDWQKKAVENAPDQAIVHYNLGITLLAQANAAEALREFKEAGYIDPTWAAPQMQQAYIYVERQDYIAAEQVARKAIGLDASQQAAHLILAISLYHQDQNQSALEAIETALQIKPTDRIARFYKARILNNLQEYNAALAIFQQLLASTTDQQQMNRLIEEIEAIHRSQPNLSLSAH